MLPANDTVPLLEVIFYTELQQETNERLGAGRQIMTQCAVQIKDDGFNVLQDFVPALQTACSIQVNLQCRSSPGSGVSALRRVHAPRVYPRCRPIKSGATLP